MQIRDSLNFTMENSSNSRIHHESEKIKLNNQNQVTKEIPNLPEEIVVEILVRLPVKSLLKFRCVSKSWLSIISSSYFIKYHLKISTEDASLANHKLLLTCRESHMHLKLCSVSSLMSEPSSTNYVSVVEYLNKRPYRTALLVVGCCNGLTCIMADRKHLMLLNPATRASIELPHVNIMLKPGFYSSYGFGYDELGDDYKVVATFHEYEEQDQELNWIMTIYSSKSNYWKRIGNSHVGIPSSDVMKYANGKLYFSMKTRLDQNYRTIGSIDLHTEVYQIVEQPSYGEGHRLFFNLWVLGGCLCVGSYNSENHCRDFWVLNQYEGCGVKEKSWTKMATVSTGFFVLMMPNSFQILMQHWPRLLLYNLKDNSVRHVERRDLSPWFRGDYYVESLVSPGGLKKFQPGGGQKRLEKC